MLATNSMKLTEFIPFSVADRMNFTVALSAQCRGTSMSAPRDHFRVELMGLEPTTPCLQSRCSSRLSYSPSRCPG